jgi:hypothetical protein
VFNRKAFTLLEVVLAIGLCGAVMALLTTAIDLYLVRVDTSRTQVETAQLARALLNQIADDLRAVRFSSSASAGGTSIGGSTGEGTSGSGATSGGSTLATGAPSDLGIYGTLTELRIDRAAQRGWRQVTVPSTQLLTDADPQDMPQTVEYFFVEGRVMPIAQFAAGGVSVDAPLEGYTGLYRRQTPTSAMTDTAGGMTSTGTTEPADLLAPEVVLVSFMYFDGTQWYEQWDSSAQQALPVAVEIKISLFSDVLSDKQEERDLDEETRRRDSSRWIEHRLVVRIPQLDEPQQLGGPSAGGQQEG